MRFDIDTQRGAICLFGLFALTVELLGYYLTGKVPPGELTGGFFTMAIGPVVSTTWQKYNEYKRQPPPDPPDQGEGQAPERRPPGNLTEFRLAMP